MANETPRFNSRLPYVVACLFGLALFFLDITYQTFDPLDRIKISSKNGDLVCQGDGEIFGAGKIEYSVIKKGLRYLS